MTMKNPIAGFRLQNAENEFVIIMEWYGESGERMEVHIDNTPRLNGFTDLFALTSQVLAHAETHGYEATVNEFPFLEDEVEADDDSSGMWDDFRESQDE